MAKADFTPLGDIELINTGALFKACEIGRDAASESGLIVVQFAYDLQMALSTIPTMDGSATRRARSVARHAKRAADHMRGVQLSFAKIPRVFMQAYSAELHATKRGRPRFDVKAS